MAQGFDQVTVVYEGPGVIPTPTPIPPPAPEPSQIVEYTIIHMDHNGDRVGEITPSQLSGSITLNEAGSISYSIPLSSEMATRALCDPDLYDWMLVRNGVPLLAGPLESVSPDTDEKEFLPVTGKTWEGYLEERIMPWNPNASNVSSQFKVYTNQDVLDIMRSLLDYVLSGPNSIPITYDNTDSGVKITAEFDPSQRSFLMEILQDYAGQQPGFDFQIDADCQLHFWAPSKGVYSDLTLALDVNVESVQYTDNRVKGTRLSLSASNQGGGNAIRVRENLTAQSQFRIRDDVVDVGTVQKLSQVNALANDEAALMVQKQRDVTIRARPQGADYWSMAGLGDWVFVDAVTPYEHLQDWFRITQIEFEQDDNNQEILTYTCSPNTIGT